MVASVGWIDDRGGVSVGWRLFIHFVAATWGLMWLGGLPDLRIFGASVDLGFFGDCLAIVYMVWLLNLYNFMDGIDGLAAIEAVTVCLGGVALYILSPVALPALLAPAVLASATSGFLLWNFPRALIFMGDTGSGFLGLMIGLFSFEALAEQQALFWGWIILLGAFVVDSTVTLFRRLARGERIYEAHRSHAYQRLARRLGSHSAVSLGFGAINTLWLLPIAFSVVMGWLNAALGVLIAYAPLVWLAFRYGSKSVDETLA